MPNKQELLELGERVDAMRRFAEACVAPVRVGDLHSTEDFFAPNAVVWRLMDDATLSAREHYAEYYDSVKDCTNVRRENIHIHPFSNGYTIQAEIKMTAPDGTELTSGPFAVILFVENGKIVRVDEYAGPKQLAWWRRRA